MDEIIEADIDQVEADIQEKKQTPAIIPGEKPDFSIEFASLGNRIRHGDQSVSIDDFESIGEDKPKSPFEKISQSTSPEKLEEALGRLTPRERTIVTLLNGIQVNDDGRKVNRMTAKEIGNQFGISGDRVKRIEMGALSNLKGIIKTL